MTLLTFDKIIRPCHILRYRFVVLWADYSASVYGRGVLPQQSLAEVEAQSRAEVEKFVRSLK